MQISLTINNGLCCSEMRLFTITRDMQGIIWGEPDLAAVLVPSYPSVGVSFHA